MTLRILLLLLLIAGPALACDGDEPDDATTQGDADTDDPPPSGTFACGNGSCDLSTHFCIVDGGVRCHSCLPIPTACEDDVTCACLDAQDHTTLELACAGQGTCTESEPGGLVLACTADGWGCG
jgi:hypothetical protein